MVKQMNVTRAAIGLALIIGLGCLPGASQNPSSQEELAKKVPVIDGGAGPCSLELHVTTVEGKPSYAVTIKVHISYGFAGTRRLDLQAATNIDGKVKFAGIPAKVKRPPLQFQAAKDNLTGTVEYDPASECQAQHDLVLSPEAPEKK